MASCHSTQNQNILSLVGEFGTIGFRWMKSYREWNIQMAIKCQCCRSEIITRAGSRRNSKTDWSAYISATYCNSNFLHILSLRWLSNFEDMLIMPPKLVNYRELYLSSSSSFHGMNDTVASTMVLRRRQK